MSAAANRVTQTPQSSSSQTATNGASPLPPKDPSERPPDMTMNGNKPPPQEQSILGGHPSTSNNVVNHSLAAAPTINTATVKQQRLHHQYKKTSDSTTSNNSVGLSGGSPTDNDAAYCTEIARRSVARAALHLGMEGMEGEALDVLGSVLLGYMETVGTTISSNVEASGRSSAHANAYDALNAVELCTAPAASQLGSAPSLVSTASQEPFRDHSRLKEAQERGWEGLASFLFGPDWFSIPLEGEDTADISAKEASAALGNKYGNNILQINGNANASAPKKAPGGKTLLPKRPNSAVNSTTEPPKSGKGKQLINMKGNDKTVSFTLDRQQSIGGGGTNPSVPGDVGDSSNNAGSAGRWHAPYLDTVPPFPLVTSTEDIDNPNRLPGSKTSLSLHDLATEMEACREPPTAIKSRRGSASDQDRKTAASAKVARLKDQVADKAMRAALRIPDDVYSTMGTIWGSIQDKDDSSNNKKETAIDGNKKPAADSKKSAGGDASKAAAASKVKFDPSTKQPPLLNTGLSEQHIVSASGSAQVPPYVPNFLPPFPTDQFSEMARDRLSASISASAVMSNVMSRMHHREKRKASALTPTEEEKTEVSDRDAVRRSVIGLGKSAGPSYWGSKWLENDSEADAKSKLNKSNTGSDFSDVTVAPSSAAKKSDANESQSQVLPLGRASGSRLSKILEGSMNVS